MRKKRIGLILVALCMLLMMSATAVAATNEVQEPFNFYVSSGGDKDSVDPALKRDNANYARIEFKSFVNTTSLPLLYRLRSNTNDTAASGLYQIDEVAIMRPVYWSGYGLYGYYYYWNIQSDSDTTHGIGSGSGIWVP